ncbi:MAG TPA: hypothetical protein VFH04_02140 [Nitrososphaeraceae archaeon]|nr:hypothetical protein [Nitrososphaeraceae archaeon]
MIQATMNGVQGDWRWCHKRQGLFFGGNPGSKCPADGGAHSKTGSTNYYIGHKSPAYPGIHGWRWCHKCQGLFFGAVGIRFSKPSERRAVIQVSSGRGLLEGVLTDYPQKTTGYRHENKISGYNLVSTSSSNGKVQH